MLTCKAQGLAARRLHGAGLRAALRDSRMALLAAVQDLDERQWRMPLQPGVNPVAWELMHVAWFAEFWLLRGPHRLDTPRRPEAARPARLAAPDHWYDSSQLPHAQRWTIALPTRSQVLDVLARQLEACLAVLPETDDDHANELPRLVLFHEDMHREALWWMRAALGYPAPPAATLPDTSPAGRVAVAPRSLRLGAAAGEGGYAFDNERQGLDVALPAFDIDRSPVTQGEFLAFVDADGYEDDLLWPAEAARWRARFAPRHPQRWRRVEGEAAGSNLPWQWRWFDRWLPLRPQAPVLHVNAWEAEAFARWAGRRLPSAAQWECAATAGLIEWGDAVWEWTRDAFQPYPGFRPGPYRDYSAPWFGDHRELRGAAFATHARMRHPRYRNFFHPWRTDVFAGFRTVST